jgi:hypothetical protein
VFGPPRTPRRWRADCYAVELLVAGMIVGRQRWRLLPAAGRDTLRAALDAGCDDLIACAESSSCPVPFTANIPIGVAHD